MSNVVISTRVRLARNLKDYPFPCKLSQQGREEVIEKVRDAVKNGNSVLADDFSYIKMSEVDPVKRVSLVERRLVSPEFISDTEGRALLLSSDNSLSIMLNEEDHIRLQVITRGLSPEQAYDTADKLDTLLDERLVLVPLSQIRVDLERLGDGYAELIRDRLRYRVSLRICSIKRSRYVSDGRLGL